jgi:hypothetical protein
MKITSTLFSLSVIAFISISCNSKIDYTQVELYIKDSESKWAESLANGDTASVNKILADDFIGTGSDGGRYTKQEALDWIIAPTSFIHNHLDSVKVIFYGNMAIARGSETWERRSGNVLKGQYVWTDTWLLRNDKWQIVAAQDNTVVVKVSSE